MKTDLKKKTLIVKTESEAIELLLQNKCGRYFPITNPEYKRGYVFYVEDDYLEVPLVQAWTNGYNDGGVDPLLTVRDLRYTDLKNVDGYIVLLS
mgnify:CR=1 FL=1